MSHSGTAVYLESPFESSSQRESQQDVNLLSFVSWSNDNSDLYGFKLITVIIMQYESTRALSLSVSSHNS